MGLWAYIAELFLVTDFVTCRALAVLLLSCLLSSLDP